MGHSRQYLAVGRVTGVTIKLDVAEGIAAGVIVAGAMLVTPTGKGVAVLDDLEGRVSVSTCEVGVNGN
jgi:hypothetical protein